MPRSFSLHLLPTLPIWAIALLCALLLLLLVQGSVVLLRKRVPGRWVTILGVLRIVIIVVFALCLLGPILSFQRQVKKNPDLMVLIDTSKSMDLPAPPGSQSRLTAALKSLRDHNVLSKLAKQYDLHYYGFDQNARALSPDELANHLANLKAQGTSTQLGQSLSDAWQMARDAAGDGPAPTQVLLISDGHDSGSADAASAAAQHGLKVDYLAMPDPPVTATPQGPVVITSLQSQPRVLLGSDATFLATLARDDTAPRRVDLALTEDGKAVVTQPVTMPAGQSELQVRVNYRPQQRGLHKYRMVILDKNNTQNDTPSTPATPAADNKNAKAAADSTAPAASPIAQTIIDAAQSQQTARAYELSLTVIDSTVNVLYIEDSYRWSFRYFKRLMEDDPSYSLTAMLSRGGGSYTRFAEPDRTLDISSFPQSAAELQGIDIIMLGDASPRHWPAGLAGALYQSVTRDGKSLVVVAGPNMSQWLAVPELLALLPVELTQDSAKPVEGPIAVDITPQGRTTSYFADPMGVFVQKLPPLDYIYPPARKRPAATVLLEASSLSTQQGQMIVMAQQTIGRGHVLFIGTDTLWKWQMAGRRNEKGVTPYSLFWQQAMRALTPVTRGASALRLQASRSRYESGQRVKLQVILTAGQLAANANVEATVTLPDEQRSPVAFLADPSEPGVFEAEFQATSPGTYRIDASAVTDKQTVGNVTATLDVSPAPGESSDIGIAQDKLAKLAAATGGQRVDPADAATWPQVDRASQTHYITQSTQIDLWNHYILLMVLCLLLGGDWLIRLLRGYV